MGTYTLVWFLYDNWGHILWFGFYMTNGDIYFGLVFIWQMGTYTLVWVLYDNWGHILWFGFYMTIGDIYFGLVFI